MSHTEPESGIPDYQENIDYQTAYPEPRQSKLRTFADKAWEKTPLSVRIGCLGTAAMGALAVGTLPVADAVQRIPAGFGISITETDPFDNQPLRDIAGEPTPGSTGEVSGDERRDIGGRVWNDYTSLTDNLDRVLPASASILDVGIAFAAFSVALRASLGVADEKRRGN
jgi:hypothetical protein